MASYTGTPFAELSRFVNRILLEKDIVKTSLQATAWLDQMRKKSETKSGDMFEVAIRNEGTSTAKTFVPGGGTSDFIGDDPYAGAASGTGTAYTGVNTYTQKDPTRNMQIRFAFCVDELRISEIVMEMSDSPAKLYEYLSSNLEYVNDNLVQLFAYQIINGAGNGLVGTLPGVSGTVDSDFYGLANQVRYFSGTPNGNSNNASDNLHFNLARHLFPALVGNVLDAGAVDDGAGTSFVTETGVTLTANSTRIQGMSGTPNYSDYLGWEIWYRPTGAGSYAELGRAYVLADAVDGTGTTTAQMSQIFRGTTGTYDVQFRPSFRSDTQGDANQFHINKLNFGYLKACDGSDMPDFGRCNNRTFYGFLEHLTSLQRWTYAEDASLKSAGYMNFVFNAARMVIDNHEPNGQVTFSNSKYSKLYFQKNFANFQLGKNGLVRSTDGRRVRNLVGDVVIGGQVVDRSPSRSVIIRNFNI